MVECVGDARLPTDLGTFRIVSYRAHDGHENVALVAGALLYLRGHEGRGIGLANKIRAYELQDQGLDNVDANTAVGLPVDSREYDVAAAMLADLAVSSVRLISNNPAKGRRARDGRDRCRRDGSDRRRPHR